MSIDCPPLLVAEGLSLGYGPVKVLEDVSLRIDGERGRIVGLRGPNGAGKSTFLKACLGLHAPSAGTLRLMGLMRGERGFRGLLSRLGYVPQSRPPGQLRLSVEEAVGLGRYGRIGFLGRTHADDYRAIRAAMERAGIGALARRAVQELSGGQYQRVAIARALAAEPELLLFDEPGSHLDTAGRRGIVELLGSLAQEKAASMLLVSHDRELLALCDTYLDFGKSRVGMSDV